ncbi:MAG: citramalate synthase [Immundisolibacter sp.]|uniref:citramalate synthase n=1 Tax=Immundisolibacter sp. TaxID=1934948 RepID=UPI003EE220E1
MSAPRIFVYDSTLRDGQQTQGIDFSVGDKLAIARELDHLGVDYIEAGWPGANPTDDAVFAAAPTFKRARLVAFGMTRRPGRLAAEDPGLARLIDSGAPAVCLVGKTWDFHVTVALRTTPEENLAMIEDSLALCAAAGREAIFDAEHFFDGYKANPAYALDCLQAGLRGGARWIVLCDTNGGSLPHEVEAIVGAVARIIPGDQLGIHCHNDTENAVANSLAAVRAGVRQVQGTLNGLGERCGNANLISLLPTLMLKLGYDTGLDEADLGHLTHASRFVDERLNRTPNRHAPYVGENAFAHKGGLHVSAVEKDPRSYEHIAPERVGNHRKILVSDQAGRANVLALLDEVGLELAPDDPRVAKLVALVKARELEGYTYDGAEASFELLARQLLEGLPQYFELDSFRVIDQRQLLDSQLVTLSEATMKVRVSGEMHMTVAEGNGPVNALDRALRHALLSAYPTLAELVLTDYKVRILESGAGTGAVTRVMLECSDASRRRWTTVGASTNVIEASWQALSDAITYKLWHDAVGNGATGEGI